MFSRKVPPTHCASGSDSIGKHVSRELIASSARRGVISVLACIVSQSANPIRPRLRCVLGLPYPQLLVEAVNNPLQFVNRRIVLLRQHFFLFLRLGLLVLRQLGRILGG